MSIFRNAVFVAAIAGLLAGLALALIQHFSTVPLILQAETYENAEPAAAESHDHAAPAATQDQTAAQPDAAEHHHDGEEWQPADGLERTFYSVVASIVAGIGYGLILVVASEFAGGIPNWRQGVLWGLAGFGVFTLAPGLGLPPELPAMPAADLYARQIWWIGTAVATAVGLACIAFRGTLGWSILGLAIIVVPHLIGAPQPADYSTPIPEALHHDFVVASTVSSLIFWVLLGGLVGLVRARWSGSYGDAQGRFA